MDEFHRFHISPQTGFLLENPLEELPSYFTVWNEITRILPKLISNKQIRNSVNEMPLLDHSRLNNHREWRLAHLQLSCIGAGYVWQDGDEGVVRSVPPQLAVPWYHVSQHLQLPPIVCHPSNALANYKLLDPEKPLCLDNIECFLMFTDTPSCRGFFEVTVAIEAAFVPALKSIMRCLKAVQDGDDATIEVCLQNIVNVLVAMKATLTKMHDRCDPREFYLGFRRFLAGWENNDALPDGLIYEGISPEPMKFAGGSAAQSVTLQCFDELFGIEHLPVHQKFLTEMRKYMLPSHRQFLNYVRSESQLRSYVKNEANASVCDLYHACLEALANFRSYHIQIVTRYITMVAKSTSSERSQSIAEKGTGGTGYMQFLKAVRDSTRDNNNE